VIVLTSVGSAAAAPPSPVVVRDVMTGTDDLGSLTIPVDPIQDYVQPDTQIEPSIAVNPSNPLNVVTAYQEGRLANGGDATNGFATSFDGGATWIHGELPGLTHYGQGTTLDQGGFFERASDAVVAFGPNNTVYANSLIFDQNEQSGLRSGIAINVSRNGGRTWSPPVIFQDDNLGGLNDKNWIVVDNSNAPGHHLGRVYAVWDRVAPVVYNYCDSNCEQLANWLPVMQTIDPVVYPGQGIGSYPVVMQSGALGIALQSLTPGAPTRATDEPDVQSGSFQQFIIAPAAGTTPWPAPLAFTPPVHVSNNHSGGVTAQRASDGLPSAAVDPKSGAVYDVWDDTRFRTDGKNDVVISKSGDEGTTWSVPTRVSPGPTGDKVNHYNAAVSVGTDGNVHVMWRQRDETAAAPLFSDVIDTYYSESGDGGATWSAPLKVNAQPSNPWYGAFSRDGTFEGDYNEIASAGGYTYITRDQGQPAYAGEAVPLVKNSATTITLTQAGKTHQHQRTWVALVRNQAGG
jgi:hypothetical protein